MNDLFEQYNRIKRWLEEVEKIFVLKPSSFQIPKDDTRNMDIIYAFFQNCYHLRDWAINSKLINDAVVDNFIQSSKDMGICRDICNGSKHLVISNPSVANNIHRTLHSSIIAAGIGPQQPEKELFYFVNVSGVPISTLDLAKNCLIQWEVFLKSQGVL